MGSATLQMASTGLAALGSSNADQYGAQAADRAADFGKVKAEQTNAQLTRNMSTTLANMDAVRAAAHVGDSPTGSAVRNQVADQLTEQKGIAVNNIGQSVIDDEAKASYLRNASTMALLGGGIGIMGDAAKAISGLPQLQGGNLPFSSNGPV